MHEDMEAAHAGECGVKCGLIAGEKGLWRGVLTEVAAQGGDLIARAGGWS